MDGELAVGQGTCVGGLPTMWVVCRLCGCALDEVFYCSMDAGIINYSFDDCCGVLFTI